MRNFFYTFKNKIFIASIAAMPLISHAQLPGWQYRRHVTIQENSGMALSNYQTLVTVNTLTIIAAGKMQNDGDDIRFASRCDGSVNLNYWIESGINTATTKIWVKIPSVAALDTFDIYMFYGNAAAAGVSSYTIFNGPYAGLSTLTSGSISITTNATRGWRFVPTEDVLVTDLGKVVPNANARTVTVWNTVTQAIVYQGIVGAGTGWQYAAVTNPFWLAGAGDFIVSEFGDNYYFMAGSTQGAPHLNYIEVRYCNACSPSTYPLNPLPGYQYGYADVRYYIRQHAIPEPTAIAGSEQTYAVPFVTASSTTICVGSSVTLSCNAGFSNYNFYKDGTSAQNGAASNYTTSTMSMGAHSVFVVTNGSGCVDTSNTISITVGTELPANAGTDVTICTNGSAQLNASGGINYTWSPSSGLSCTNCSDPMANPSATINYTLVVSDASGCTGTDSVTVFVDPCTGISSSTISNQDIVIIPNPTTGKFYLSLSPSPNGEGRGEVEIYNVMGEKVFTSYFASLPPSPSRSAMAEQGGRGDGGEVDLSSQPAGVYFLKIISEKESVMYKLIKQ